MRLWQIASPVRANSAARVAVALAAAILLGTPVPGEADAEPKRIMMLHSFGPRFKPWIDYVEIVRSEISHRAQMPVIFHDHALQNAQLQNDKSDGPFIDYLGALYEKKHPDLIIAFGSPAARFVQRYRDRLFPGTPMIFTAVEARRVQHDKLTENDAVVATHNDYAAAIENILQVLPGTKTIFIVNGASANERFWEGELRRELAPFSNRVELKWSADLPFEGILKKAANLPRRSAIFWHLMNVDAAGVVHETDTALNRLSATANAPIFSLLDVFFGEAVVGGPMQSSRKSSEAAANVALRMLAGEKGGNIKTPPIESALPKFDWRQLQRWHISERRLPPHSDIYFREPGLLRRYPGQIAFFVVLVLVQAGLISILLHERGRRRLAEVQSRQRMEELAHINRYSTAGELTASIAHEINQPLGAILVNAETARSILTGPRPDLDELRDIVDDILHDNRRAGEVIRRMRSLLRKAPFELTKLDLDAVVHETVEFLSALAIGRRVELNTNLAPTTLPIVGDPVQLQQVILNLAVNAIDAMADMPVDSRKISIRTQRVENFAELSISDSGPGIPAEKLKRIFDPFFSSKAEGMGMGLSIARTIVEAHNGRIWAENKPGGGASFRIRLPLDVTTA